jgi:short-subunit dehydrogenase
MSELSGRVALVTGASSGLGADFARELAARGCHLVLVARREERMKELEREIRGRHGVDVRVVALDLAEPDAPARLHAQLREADVAVDVLVNNAGFGVYGPFVEVPWEREREMLAVDVVALTHLTKLFARDMVARGRGWILQVASIGAYQPSPSYGTYSAAKSFVLHSGEALAWELRRSGVRVSVVSPGVTKTEFLEVAGQKPSLYQRLAMMESPRVVRVAVDAMLRGKPSVVPGLLNKLTVFMIRFTPRRLAAATASLFMTAGARR